ncbi:MAG TPA: DUF167 domain-containing protein [Terriglobia bacterium]|nr:DUF167 domain-containing protein [Terriglobia bacterium]
MPDIHVEGNTVTFWLKVKPRSPRERLKVNASGELQLEVHVPPAEGEANAASRAFLANRLRIPIDAVRIQTGLKSRRKLIRITSPKAQAIVDELRNAVSE